jgi:hypothetical protein
MHSRRYRCLVADLADQLGVTLAVEGLPQRQQLVERGTQSVDVSSWVGHALKALGGP